MASPVRYVSFSGGGWNTHTASAGFIGAGLQAAKRSNSQYTFENLFAHQNGAGGNSGGSWFLTMLAYSNEFADALANRPDDWFSSNEYMGIQKQIFSTPSSGDFNAALANGVSAAFTGIVESTSLYTLVNNLTNKIPGLAGKQNAFTKEVIDTLVKFALPFLLDSIEGITHLEQGLYTMLATKAGTSELDWLSFVGDTAYSSYGMKELMENNTFSAPRNSWAEALTLVLPTSYDTSKVLNYNKIGALYDGFSDFTSNTSTKRKVILPGSIIVPQGSNGSYSLLGENATRIYERQGMLGTNSTSQNLSQIFNSNLKILEAATISGAFAGDFASVSTLQDVALKNIDKLFTEDSLKRSIKDWLYKQVKSDGFWSFTNKAKEDLINLTVNEVLSSKDNKTFMDYLGNALAPILGGFTKGLAVPLSFANGTVSYAEPIQDGNLDTLATNSNYRHIDGGYTDNTAVANIVSNIQQEFNIGQDFDLTFFLNGSDSATISKEITGTNDITINSDFAKLFGGGSEDETQIRPFELDGLGSVEGAYPYIFQKDAWLGKKEADWSYTSGDTIIEFFKLDVETIDNPYWNIKKGQKGEVNVFTTTNKNTVPGPLKDDAFDIYESIYKATREGILNQGGYISLLGALNIQNLQAKEGNKVKFSGDANIQHKVQVDYNQSSSDYLHLVNLYKVDDTGSRSYLGSVGGSKQEKDISYDYKSNIFVLKTGEHIEFEYEDKNNQSSTSNKLVVKEKSDNNYSLIILDSSTNKTIASMSTTFVAFNSQEDGVRLDTTQRDSSDDTYMHFKAGETYNVSIQAIASYRNQLGMIQVEIDPVTGVATYQGHAIDTQAFEDAVRASLISDGTGFGVQTLNPFSQQDGEWVIQEDGHYAPVLITENNRLFVLGHDLQGGSTHSRYLGENTIGFEDLSIIQNPDFDFNDARITFTQTA